MLSELELISRIDRRNAAARTSGPCSGFGCGGGVGVFSLGEGVLGWGEGVFVLAWERADELELDDELLLEDRERTFATFVTSSRGDGDVTAVEAAFSTGAGLGSRGERV